MTINLTDPANHPANGLLAVERIIRVREELQRSLCYQNGGDMAYVIADAIKGLEELLVNLEAVLVPVVPDFGLHRDANRYRFLRDKDAFGDECAPGLASWDDLAELESGEFDSAVDARLLSCGMPQHILTEAEERTATAGVYAELYRLREEIKGPDGFDTWKDAAIAERKARVEFEKTSPRLSDIDYLGAMAAYHSNEWHKMDPITGYMHGWNACRAAMLHSNPEPTPQPSRMSGIMPDYEGVAMTQRECYMAGKEAGLAEARKSPVIPDGYVLVPVEPTLGMLDEFDSIIDYGAEDSKDAWRRLLTAAPQEVK